MSNPSDPGGIPSSTSEKVHLPPPVTFYTPQALADLLGVGTRRVRQLLSEAGVGKLGDRYVLTADDMDAVLRRQSGRRASRMAKTANKTMALESFLRLNKRIDELSARADAQAQRVWACEKQTGAVLDQLGEIRREQMDCIRRKLDKPAE